MGPHEVVNGANGSVTWCQGPPWCPQCNAANPAPSGTVHVLPMAGHCPGCRCQQATPTGSYTGCTVTGSLIIGGLP